MSDRTLGVIFWLALTSAIVATHWLDWFFAGFFYGAIVGGLLMAYAVENENEDES